MSRVIAPTSIDANLEHLLREIDENITQLPEFQRDWIWDDQRIRSLIASISQGYPMGAIMRLNYGTASMKFKYRTIEGAKDKGIIPAHLILDGQQRITSIYNSAYSRKPVITRNDNGKEIHRFYYLDINECLNPNTDRIDAVISVPENRKIMLKPGSGIVDLNLRRLEYEYEMFPLNIIFDSSAREDWADGYKEYHGNTAEYKHKFKQFRSEVIDTIIGYKLPVITLDASTPKEAVCKVFENVNTGGVTLTVFELVTASFAADDFNLRADWEKCRAIITGSENTSGFDLMSSVDEVSFLTAVTLYSSYMKPGVPTACTKRDVLNLSLVDYLKSREAVLEGYIRAKKFLLSQCIFFRKNLPYSPQVTILAAICAVLTREDLSRPGTAAILTKWFWCGVLGEMYGNLTHSSYTNDIEDVTAAIRGERSLNRTVNSAFFSATRLITLKTRGSAAYKGVMALLYRSNCMDFLSGAAVNARSVINDTSEIRHIFPKAYCKDKMYPSEKYDSIINKTPLLPITQKLMDKSAPSVYSTKIILEASISREEFRKRVESNLIDYDAFISDDFNAYFIDRAKRLLRLIEQAMGKPITDKDSAQTIAVYGESLA